MIIDDYENIAKRLKEIKKREMRDERTLDDEIDDFLMGNEEESSIGYPEYNDIYVGYQV